MRKLGFVVGAGLAAWAPGSVIGMESGAKVVVETLSGELDGGTGGVSVDRDGNIYVADFGAILSDRETMGRKIFKLSPTGTAEVFATGFEGASGNELDSKGFLYQSNIRGNFISRVAPDGSHTVLVREGIVAPVGVVIDEADVLFVANCGDGSIQRVTPDGVSERFVESELFNCPNGITLDDEHNIYVANFYNGDVLKITPEREVRRLATMPGNNNGHLTYFENHLYVVARGDHRIHRVSLDGEITPFAGSGERGRKDGPATEAQFSYPNDIAVDPEARVFYVNEIASTTTDSKLLSPMIVRRIRFE